MNKIEEYSHQLFSSLIDISRKFETFTFEDQSFGSGTGPLFCSPEGDLFFDFTGECGLLGHGHPLSLKINTLKLLRDRIPQDMSENRATAEAYISDLLNQKLYFCQPSNLYQNIWAGRTSTFTSHKIKEPTNLSGLFSRPIAVSPEKSYFPDNHLEEALTLKFLTMGQFYGSNGLIKQREEQLCTFLGSNPNIQDIEGLNVKIKDRKLPHNFLVHSNAKTTLRFPLTFNEEILRKVNELLCL